MARKGRFDTEHLDLTSFEAWLRTQLVGPAFAAVITVVMQMLRALFEQNLQLRMRLLGRRPKPPSERLEAVERQLAFAFAVPRNDVAPASIEAPSPPTPTPERPPRARAKPRPRQPVPSHVLRIEVPNPIPDAERWCATCAVPMRTMRHRAVETVDVIPARVVVRRRLDEIVACPRCDAMRCAKAPPSVLDGGLLGPTLVTEALCDKILDGMPVERQARRYSRAGTPVAASTLGRSVGAVLALLKPLAARILVRWIGTPTGWGTGTTTLGLTEHPLRATTTSVAPAREAGRQQLGAGWQTRGDEVMETTKTGRHQRVTLPADLVSILLWHIDTLPEGAMADSELLFPSDTGSFRAPSVLDKPFRVVTKALGLRKKVTPRAMRRTFQDLARAAEVRDIVTRAVSGHATEEMQRHYSTVHQNEIRDGIARIIDLGEFRKAMASGADPREEGGLGGAHGGAHRPEMTKAS